MATTLPPATEPISAGAVLLVRADASSRIGVGHTMRCLAIAEAWRELGGDVVLASVEIPDVIADRYRSAGARVAIVVSTEEAANVGREAGARFAVIDGYHLGEADQQALKQAGMRLLVVDDRGQTATAAVDLVLDQNATARPEMYAQLGAKLLLGLQYVLLRREFRTGGRHAVAETARHVLVTFGGADTLNLTPVAIEALAPLDVEVLVIAGAANPHAGALVAPAGARASIQIVPAVDDMAARMGWADLAIVAAGSTCWELAASGVPMIAIPVADNQLAVSEALGPLGIGVPLSCDAADASTLRAAVKALAGDAIWRASMARIGRELIDGRGALRVCAALRDDGAGR